MTAAFEAFLTGLFATHLAIRRGADLVRPKPSKEEKATAARAAHAALLVLSGYDVEEQVRAWHAHAQRLEAELATLR